jgi:hypothetical protein
MGRRRRIITKDGHLQCTKCGKWKHISEYYCPGDAYVGVPDPHDPGTTLWFGKPQSWCKTCVRDYNRARNEAARQERDQRALERADLERAYQAEQERVEYQPQRLGPASIEEAEAAEAEDKEPETEPKEYHEPTDDELRALFGDAFKG